VSFHNSRLFIPDPNFDFDADLDTEPTFLNDEDQCCGSGMFIPDPDFYPSRISDPGSRIPDPKTATKERDEKKFVTIHLFYVATNFTKLNIILVLKCRRKYLGQFSKIYRTFYPKNCH
jgi:hypothetical protein